MTPSEFMAWLRERVNDNRDYYFTYGGYSQSQLDMSYGRMDESEEILEQLEKVNFGESES